MDLQRRLIIFIIPLPETDILYLQTRLDWVLLDSVVGDKEKCRIC